MLGNKSDRESERKVQKGEVEQWCRANDNIPFYETSANDLKNMEQAIQEMTRKAIKKE